jgi:hypothetical protein
MHIEEVQIIAKTKVKIWQPSRIWKSPFDVRAEDHQPLLTGQSCCFENPCKKELEIISAALPLRPTGKGKAPMQDEEDKALCVRKGEYRLFQKIL